MDTHQAATWADQAEDFATTTALPRRKGFGHLARAWTLQSIDPAKSATEALAAATLFDQGGDSVDAGRPPRPCAVFALASFVDTVLSEQHGHTRKQPHYLLFEFHRRYLLFASELAD